MKRLLLITMIIQVVVYPFYSFSQEVNEVIQPQEVPSEPLPNDIPQETLQSATPVINSAPAVIQQSSAPGKISLDIKGMDVVDVLKMLAVRSGLNIVVGKNVAGRVTLFLRDVDVWDAFELIILSNDLAYEKKGIIVNVMTQRDYELIYGERYQDKKEARVIHLKYAKAVDLARALTQIKTSIGRVVVDEGSNTLVLLDAPAAMAQMEDFIKKTDLPLSTRVFTLNNAQAEKLSVKLQESITKGVGSVKIDERTNKIIVTDYPNRIAEIAQVVEAFDERNMQVLIDAQIVEISPDKDEYSMGIDWDYWLKKNARFISSLPAPALSSVTSIPSMLSFGVAASGDQATVDSKGQYKAVVDALRLIGKTKILSSPRIMALNNQEARILVGTKDAYITSTTSQGGNGNTVTSQEVNFVDVGLKLYVTPVASHDGFVTMKIKPEISSATRTNITSDGKITQVPIVTTSETETTVMVKDGTTIIIAGLKKDKTENEVRKVPVLGDVPILGAAFRNVKDEKNKTELVIFLTPRIVTGAEPLEYQSLTNDKDIRQLQAQALENSLEQADDSSYNHFVVKKIKSVAATEKTGGVQGNVLVEFTISQQGNLVSEPRIIQASNRDLEGLAALCIKKAAPFPPFPASFLKKQLLFKINLAFESLS